MTKLISSETGVDLLLCACGNHYTHIDKVEAARSSYNKEDVDVSIEGSCEAGHRFRVRFEQRKGNTHVDVDRLDGAKT